MKKTAQKALNCLSEHFFVQIVVIQEQKKTNNFKNIIFST